MVSAPAQLSPQMRQRYGMDRNPWPVRVLVALVVLGYGVGLALLGGLVTQNPIQARVLVWQQPTADRVDITFDVNKAEGMAVQCALRAQDADRIDVGYATVELPRAPGYVQQTYPMRVLGPATYVEVLGCAGTGQLKVPPPSFPPGVVPPAQPWTPGP